MKEGRETVRRGEKRKKTEEKKDGRGKRKRKGGEKGKEQI